MKVVSSRRLFNDLSNSIGLRSNKPDLKEKFNIYIGVHEGDIRETHSSTPKMVQN